MGGESKTPMELGQINGLTDLPVFFFFFFVRTVERVRTCKPQQQHPEHSTPESEKHKTCMSATGGREPGRVLQTWRVQLYQHIHVRIGTARVPQLYCMHCTLSQSHLQMPLFFDG